MNLRQSVWIVGRKGKTGKTYNVRWLCPRTGKMRSRSCGPGIAGKELAKRVLAKIRDELARDALSDPIAKPWSEFVDEFMAVQRAKKRPNTVERYRAALDVFAEVCSPATIVSVTPLMVEEFIAERRKVVRATTINSDLRHLKAAMEKASLWYHLPRNPVGAVEFLKVAEKELRVLGVDEVVTLLDTCRALADKAHALRWETFCYLALTCGLRRGELLNLRWQDVDNDGAVIRLVCREDWETKSGKNRVAFLDTHALELLSALRENQAERLKLSEFVFVSETGEQWGQNLSRDFQWLVDKTKLPHFTLHDLRRTFCTALANANVQEALVQKLAGHASMATTLKYYTKISQEAARNASRSLPYRVGQTPVDNQSDSANPAHAMRDVS